MWADTSDMGGGGRGGAGVWEGGGWSVLVFCFGFVI